MRKVRNSSKRANHHSGTTAIGYRVKRHAAKGHAAPFVAAFADVYSKDKNAAPRVVMIFYLALYSYVFLSVS